MVEDLVSNFTEIPKLFSENENRMSIWMVHVSVVNLIKNDYAVEDNI